MGKVHTLLKGASIKGVINNRGVSGYLKLGGQVVMPPCPPPPVTLLNKIENNPYGIKTFKVLKPNSILKSCVPKFPDKPKKVNLKVTAK